GYEPAAVEATFGSLGGLLATARLVLFGPRRSAPAPEPAPDPIGLRLQANGLPALPVINRVAPRSPVPPEPGQGRRGAPCDPVTA
ncbi:MAG: hypothetical protein ACKOCX_13125, partial [Planctomycetota bacterium]